MVAARAVERVRAFALWAKPEALAAAWSGKGYIWGDLTMNNPQDTDTAIEQVAAEAPESEDFDLSDEALDRPLEGGVARASGTAVCWPGV